MPAITLTLIYAGVTNKPITITAMTNHHTLRYTRHHCSEPRPRLVEIFEPGDSSDR